MFSPRHFTTRWTGFVVPPCTGNYTFRTIADDGARLWIDGTLLIDAWSVTGETPSSATIALTAAQSSTIQMDYFQDVSGYSAVLGWESDCSQSPVAFPPVPSSSLYTCTTSGPVVGPEPLDAGPRMADAGPSVDDSGSSLKDAHPSAADTGIDSGAALDAAASPGAADSATAAVAPSRTIDAGEGAADAQSTAVGTNSPESNDAGAVPSDPPPSTDNVIADGGAAPTPPSCSTDSDCGEGSVCDATDSCVVSGADDPMDSDGAIVGSGAAPDSAVPSPMAAPAETTAAAPMVITGISPASGPVAGLTPFRIVGENFVDPSTVIFRSSATDTAAATAINVVVSADGTTISGVTPPHAPDVVQVVITNSRGGNQATVFTYACSVDSDCTRGACSSDSGKGLCVIHSSTATIGAQGGTVTLSGLSVYFPDGPPEGAAVTVQQVDSQGPDNSYSPVYSVTAVSSTGLVPTAVIAVPADVALTLPAGFVLTALWSDAASGWASPTGGSSVARKADGTSEVTSTELGFGGQSGLQQGTPTPVRVSSYVVASSFDCTADIAAQENGACSVAAASGSHGGCAIGAPGAVGEPEGDRWNGSLSFLTMGVVRLIARRLRRRFAQAH